MQSLNVGMWEADELSATLTNVLLGNVTAADSETTWNHRWREEWLRLLGRDRNWSPAINGSEWISRRRVEFRNVFPPQANNWGSCQARSNRCVKRFNQRSCRRDAGAHRRRTTSAVPDKFDLFGQKLGTRNSKRISVKEW